jgi:hypothetical protein
MGFETSYEQVFNNDKKTLLMKLLFATQLSVETKGVSLSCVTTRFSE